MSDVLYINQQSTSPLKISLHVMQSHPPCRMRFGQYQVSSAYQLCWGNREMGTAVSSTECKHKHARLGGSGGMLPKKNKYSEIALAYSITTSLLAVTT